MGFLAWSLHARRACAIPIESEAMNKSECRNREQVLQEVRALVERGLPDQALNLIKATDAIDPVMMNAAGVCHLRAGRPTKAIEVFHRLCVGDGIGLRPGVSPLHVANFATALLLVGNLHGCRHHLRHVEQSHPVAVQLQSAIAEWERSLRGWQRLLLPLGMCDPKRPIDLDSPPGAFQ